jgi:hypothetical protein
MDSNEDTSN